VRIIGPFVADGPADVENRRDIPAKISAYRFIGAAFEHAIASAVFGRFRQ
jgi:hypothetical protein